MHLVSGEFRDSSLPYITPCSSHVLSLIPTCVSPTSPPASLRVFSIVESSSKEEKERLLKKRGKTLNAMGEIKADKKELSSLKPTKNRNHV